MISLRWLALVLLLATVAGGARGHALDPVYVELTALGDDRWQAVWRVPDVNGRPMPLRLELPAECTPGAPGLRANARAWTAAWIAHCPGGIAGGRLAIPGLEATRTDALARVQRAAGAPVATLRLTPETPMLTLETETAVGVAEFFRLGVEHILLGVDHLLFVAALMLVVRGRRALILAITAFTVAHSLTLAAAASNLFFVPSAPVDALVALSIAFLAAEIVRGGGLTAARPWPVAFAFGLLHGLGFGSALVEIGLPSDAVPVALLAFNLGVEAGQLLFVAAAAAVVWSLARLIRPVPRLRAPAARTTVAYGIGSLAMLWTFDRVVAFAG